MGEQQEIGVRYFGLGKGVISDSPGPVKKTEDCSGVRSRAARSSLQPYNWVSSSGAYEALWSRHSSWSWALHIWHLRAEHQSVAKIRTLDIPDGTGIVLPKVCVSNVRFWMTS
jgi:hypothetical protein